MIFLHFIKAAYLLFSINKISKPLVGLFILKTDIFVRQKKYWLTKNIIYIFIYFLYIFFAGSLTASKDWLVLSYDNKSSKMYPVPCVVQTSQSKADSKKKRVVSLQSTIDKVSSLISSHSSDRKLAAAKVKVSFLLTLYGQFFFSSIFGT